MKKRLSLRTKEAIACYLFLTPMIVGILVFQYIPTIASLVLSFTRWNFLRAPEFIGVANYVEIFTRDIRVTESAVATLYYAFVGVPLVLLLSFSMAMFLSTKRRGVGIFRTIYYIPTLVFGSAAIMVFFGILFAENGIINSILFNVFNINGPNYLQTAWAMPTLIFIALWGLGSSFIVFLAALKGVPDELYESASLDGAGFFRKLRSITVPYVSPVILFNLIIGFIGGFQVFNQAAALTQGGPGNATRFWVYNLYLIAFRDLRAGYATALAWLLFIITMLFSLLIFKTSAKLVFYSGDQHDMKTRF